MDLEVYNLEATAGKVYEEVTNFTIEDGVLWIYGDTKLKAVIADGAWGVLVPYYDEDE